MSIIVNDLSEALKQYSTSATPTKSSAMQSFMINQNTALQAVAALLNSYEHINLQRLTAYTVGQTVYSPNLPSNLYLVCTTAGTTDSSEIDISSLVVGDTIPDGTVVWQLETTAPSIQVAAAPSYYHRQKLMTVEPISVTVYPTWVNVGTRGFVSDTSVTLKLSTSSSWDNSTYITAANRAGKDFYIYACQQSTSIPKFILSANSTVPTGYTATNSRKIGGFHCLCLTAKEYLTGDIIPNTVWDLHHRPISNPEGMFYKATYNKWYQLYLTDVNLNSTYKGVIADGASSPTFCWYDFVERAAVKNLHLITQEEFIAIANGSNQGTNILGSADPNTTGGHVDIANTRMISDDFAEDCCGCSFQWTKEACIVSNTAWEWKTTSITRHEYTPDGGSKRVVVGGHWEQGDKCGSSTAAWDHAPFSLDDFVGCRLASEPLIVK